MRVQALLALLAVAASACEEPPPADPCAEARARVLSEWEPVRAALVDEVHRATELSNDADAALDRALEPHASEIRRRVEAEPVAPTVAQDHERRVTVRDAVIAELTDAAALQALASAADSARADVSAATNDVGDADLAIEPSAAGALAAARVPTTSRLEPARAIPGVAAARAATEAAAAACSPAR